MNVTFNEFQNDKFNFAIYRSNRAQIKKILNDSFKILSIDFVVVNFSIFYKPHYAP